jgi:hypothetical protein
MFPRSGHASKKFRKISYYMSDFVVMVNKFIGKQHTLWAQFTGRSCSPSSAVWQLLMLPLISAKEAEQTEHRKTCSVEDNISFSCISIRNASLGPAESAAAKELT